MGFTWYCLGLLTTGSTIFLWHFSKRYQLNWLAWSGLSLGIVLILFQHCLGRRIGSGRGPQSGQHGASIVRSFRYRHFNVGLSIHLNQKTEDASNLRLNPHCPKRSRSISAPKKKEPAESIHRWLRISQLLCAMAPMFP